MPKEPERPAHLPVSEVFVFGQVLVTPLGNGRFRLCHRDELEQKTGGEIFSTPEAALQIASADASGDYRPLKTAPNLRTGWELNVDNIDDLERALDYFYPGRLAVLQAQKEDRLNPTPLRETLGRQSGMYRVAANISDAQLDCLIAEFCRSDSGCLRTILWKRDVAGDIPSTKLPSEKFDPAYDQALTGGADPVPGPNIPLLCQESCNLLVAECRKVVKGERHG